MAAHLLLRGLVLILVAFVSPVAHLGGELVIAHMVQHLMIGDIAALLIVLGLTALDPAAGAGADSGSTGSAS